MLIQVCLLGCWFVATMVDMDENGVWASLDNAPPCYFDNENVGLLW